MKNKELIEKLCLANQEAEVRLARFVGLGEIQELAQGEHWLVVVGDADETVVTIVLDTF